MRQTTFVLAFLCTVLKAPAQDRVLPDSLASSLDSVVAFASDQYAPHSFFRRLFMGNNYRKAWQQKVTLPVFHFSTSGFQVKELGGSMQTKSLHLVDVQGKNWSLRTVNKTITEGGLAPALRNHIGRNVSQDIISGAFPYAAPLAGELCVAAGLNVAKPQVFFVSDDPALGPYRSIFANTICTLEERDPGFDNTDNSTTLLENITADIAYKIQQPLLLRTRLMDMLMADWDRHANNWRWGLKDSAGFHFYYAVPRDRDWAFYMGKGWVPQLLQKTGAYRCFVSFDEKLKNVKDQSWKCWTFDRSLLNEMTANDWNKAIEDITVSLSDAVIEKTVQKLPGEVYASEGERFIHKLKSRRDALQKEVMKYYRFLSEEVVINGSDQDEWFSVSSKGDSLKVCVYRADSSRQKVYERIFSPAETFFITLNGLGGDDLFEVQENVHTRIRLRINGGKGADRYDLKGSIRTKIYDESAEENVIVHNTTAKLYFH